MLSYRNEKLDNSNIWRLQMQAGVLEGSLNNSELAEDLMQQDKLHPVSDLNDFVELCYGEFFGRCVKLQPSLLI